MREFIRSLIDRHRLERFRMLLARLGPEPPEDPYSAVRHPRTRMPGNRSAAAEVQEPREAVRTDVVGRAAKTDT